jgi:hypothetical protein
MKEGERGGGRRRAALPCSATVGGGAGLLPLPQPHPLLLLHEKSGLVSNRFSKAQNPRGIVFVSLVSKRWPETLPLSPPTCRPLIATAIPATVTRMPLLNSDGPHATWYLRQEHLPLQHSQPLAPMVLPPRILLALSRTLAAHQTQTVQQMLAVA